MSTNDKVMWGELLKQVFQQEDIKLVEYLFFGFIVVGIIIKTITFNINLGSSDVGPATGTIWGYSIMLFSLFGLMFISIDTNKINFKDQVKNIPYCLYAIIIILLWNIVLNSRFYSKINSIQNNSLSFNESSKYNLWNTWSITIIIVLSLLCVVDYFKNKLLEKSKDSAIFKTASFQINMYSLIVFFSAVIVTSIQQSILENYLVDG